MSQPTPVEPLPIDPADETPTALEVLPLCPLCNAEITDPDATRCAKCGHAFGGKAQLAYASANPDGPGWFVETADRPFAAGWSTSLWAVYPRRLWAEVTPFITPRRVRLRRFIVTGSFWTIALVVAAGVFARLVQEFIGDLEWGSLAQALTAARPGGIFSWTIRDILVGHWRGWLVMVLAWPWVVYAGLLIFQQTLRKAGVDRGHVARVAFYGADPRIAVPLLVLPTSFLWRPIGDLFFPYHFPISRFAFMVMTVWWLIVTYRVGRGMTLYLRLPQPWTTTLLVQAIAGFVAVLALLNL